MFLFDRVVRPLTTLFGFFQWQVMLVFKRGAVVIKVFFFFFFNDIRFTNIVIFN